jgi:putative FmdB family regulatory protein
VPTYEYECEKCGECFERFQSITARPLRKCPKCGGKARRKIGAGGGIIFKGSGFYETDYKRSKTPSTNGPRETKSSPDKKESDSGKKDSKTTQKDS